MANQYVNSNGDFRILIDCVCLYCGAAFTRRPSAIKQGGGRYCGNTCTRKGRSGSFESRFWDKVNKDGPIIRPELGPCWIWIACTFTDGYGCINFNGKRVGAHRVSWQVHNGPIPDALQVLHHCDNRSCVNPSHFFLGTNQDNVADKIRKGRAKTSDKCRSLSVEQVQDIRRRIASGQTFSTLAIEYRRSLATISAIVHHRTYRNV